MNKILLAFAVLLSVVKPSKAQVLTLEHAYYPSTYGQPIKLQDEGDKYLLFDTSTKKYNLYNPDHSHWKTLNYSLPANSGIYGIQCVSTKLFNNDSRVEFAIYHAYLQSSPPAWIYTTNIVDEDGKILQSLPGISGLGVFKMNGEWKVAGTNYIDYKWQVFGVPGTMPDPAALKPEPRMQGETSIYPNPMSTAATLEYTLPAGATEGTVEILGTSGQVLKAYRVTNQFNNILIDRNELPAGNYIYKVTGSPAKSFVIQ